MRCARIVHRLMNYYIHRKFDAIHIELANKYCVKYVFEFYLNAHALTRLRIRA